jgi:hypothetical protein
MLNKSKELNNMKNYSVELHVTQIHDIEVIADNYEEARNQVMSKYYQGDVYPCDDTNTEEQAKVVSFVTSEVTQ